MRSVYRGVTLIDGQGRSPVEHAVVAVENNRFVYAGPAKGYVAGHEDRKIEAGHLFMIPGLIDCHVHVDLHGFADTFSENQVEDKLRTLRAAKEMSGTLRSGFTTVRNLGSVNQIDIAVKAGVTQGYFEGPRILSCGRIISMTCSGTDYFDGMYEVADGPDQCRKAARKQLKHGADCLKLMATGAVMNPGGVPGAAQLDVDEMAAVVNEGLKLGVHTAAHAHGAEGIVNAVRAGVRTIEHGTMADEAAIRAMADNGTFLVPTLSLHDCFEAHAQDIPLFMLEKGRAMQAAYNDVVKAAVRAGVPVALGTDAGTNYNYHGRNAAELGYLVDHGIMTPAQAITAATKTAARAIMADDHLGTIEAGKLADFVLLRADPLTDIHRLSDPVQFEGVYKEGKAVATS